MLALLCPRWVVPPAAPGLRLPRSSVWIAGVVNRNPPRTLDSLSAWGIISDNSLLYSAVSTYLRKLGWPGVCEFGAGVPLVLPAPSPTCGGVSSLITLVDTDISCRCLPIDSSPADGGWPHMQGECRVSEAPVRKLQAIVCRVGANRSPWHDLSLGISRFSQGLQRALLA